MSAPVHSAEDLANDGSFDDSDLAAMGLADLG
jgi:hypothetical protein